MSIRSKGTYQGYPIQGVAYRRSQGLSPEPGFVDIDFKSLKSWTVDIPTIPWRSLTNAPESRGGLSIRSFNLDTATKTVSKKFPDPVLGLNIRGDLVMETSSSDGNPVGRPIVYRDVYLDEDGMEELEEDFLNARKHNEGIIRLTVTDIRKFWVNHGVVIQRINIRGKNGEFDRRTVDTDVAGKFVPWSAERVISFLLDQLPGSPIIHPKSDLGKLALENPPVDELGELAVKVLGAILDENGLSASLQPDNQILISRSNGARVPLGKIPVDLGVYETPENLESEKKTFTIHARSPLVQVLGAPRVRRNTLAYVAIFQDQDGRYYRLEDIGSVWKGYSIEQVNKQVLNGEAKNFRDVPPDPAGGGFFGIRSVQTSGGKDHVERQEIMRKWAYKGYAPALFFDSSSVHVRDINRRKNIAVTDTVGVPFLTNVDFDTLDFVPMRETPMHQSDLERSSLKAILDPEGRKGDLDDLILMPPIVHASQLAVGFFTGIDEIEDFFNDKKRQSVEDLNKWNDYIIQSKKRLSKYVNILKRHEAVAKATFDFRELKKQFVKDDGVAILIENDVKEAAATVGVQFDTKFIRETDNIKTAEVFIFLIKTNFQDIKRWEKFIEQEKLKITKWNKKFSEFKAIHKKFGGNPLIHNLPNRRIEEGTFTLDRNTGIIMFPDPTCHVDLPFMIDSEAAEVVSDGQVSVTFGYELRTNTIADLTSVMFTAVGEGEESDVPVVGFSRSSPIKTRIERIPTMRLYETDLGTPLNLSEVIAQARAKASGHLKQATKVEGRIFKLHGLRQAVLDVGVSSIQHVFDGDKGKTIIAVNAPGANLELGAPRHGQEEIARARRVRTSVHTISAPREEP